MPVEKKYQLKQVRKGVRRNVKYIFVSGGVMSALGKGITSAPIAMLLKAKGFSVCPIKCENYLNVDAGTMNPIEHGDPFLCVDGLEADQDLGNYERFLGQEVGYQNFITMGSLYQTVINRERRMEYDGEDVEPIPHIVNEIIDRLHKAANDTKADFVIVELGGTVGEYENNNGLYYEAARIIALSEPVAHVHVTYVPVPPHIGEQKTKPAQMGIKELMRMGISPDFIVVRSEKPVDLQRKYKFAFKFHIDPDDVFSNENLDSVYRLPLHLHAQHLDERILKFFKVKPRKSNLRIWKSFVTKIDKSKSRRVSVAIVGKYFGTGDFDLWDSYYSLVEALKDAAVELQLDLNLIKVNSDKELKSMSRILKKVDAVIVPIGWGKRGVEGKLSAITYARTHKIPFLGLCYGMQLACVEYAQNVAGLKGANTEEIDFKAAHKIIHSIPFDKKYQVIKGDGVSMRLGSYDCVLKTGSLAYEVYKKFGKSDFMSFSSDVSFPDEVRKEAGRVAIVRERHRHRFEFNNAYKDVLKKHGLIFSGLSPDGVFVEMIELAKSKHPFFLATQGHPEYRSRPGKPHPVFMGFLTAAMAFKKA